MPTTRAAAVDQGQGHSQASPRPPPAGTPLAGASQRQEIHDAALRILWVACWGEASSITTVRRAWAPSTTHHDQKKDGAAPYAGALLPKPSTPATRRSQPWGSCQPAIGRRILDGTQSPQRRVRGKRIQVHFCCAGPKADKQRLDLITLFGPLPLPRRADGLGEAAPLVRLHDRKPVSQAVASPRRRRQWDRPHGAGQWHHRGGPGSSAWQQRPALPRAHQ